MKFELQLISRMPIGINTFACSRDPYWLQQLLLVGLTMISCIVSYRIPSKIQSFAFSESYLIEHPLMSDGRLGENTLRFPFSRTIVSLSVEYNNAVVTGGRDLLIETSGPVIPSALQVVHPNAMKSSSAIWRYWPAAGLFVFDRVSSARYTRIIHRRVELPCNAECFPTE